MVPLEVRSRVGVAEGVWREGCVCACERVFCPFFCHVCDPSSPSISSSCPTAACLTCANGEVA